MAKAAKKSAAKPAAKAAAKPVAKAKSEKKAATPKKEAPKKDTAHKKSIAPKKLAPAKEVEEAEQEIEVEEEEMEVEVAPVPKISKKEKAAKAAADKILSDDLKKWSDFKEKFGSQKAAPYNMSATYEAHQPLQHKVLGWGYILSVQNDRLEVLFESGSKVLISNYKSS
jgi:hypothetical protein